MSEPPTYKRQWDRWKGQSAQEVGSVRLGSWQRLVDDLVSWRSHYWGESTIREMRLVWDLLELLLYSVGHVMGSLEGQDNNGV